MPTLTSALFKVKASDSSQNPASQEYQVVAVGFDNYGKEILLGYRIPLGNKSKLQRLTAYDYTVIS